MNPIILWWMKSHEMLLTKIAWCANEIWCYSKWMLTKVCVISSMFSNGLSSPTRREGIWDVRRCRCTRTLAESKTMQVISTYFYVMFNHAIRFDPHKVWCAWNLDESANLDSLGRFDVHIMVEILFIRPDAHKVWCAWTLDESRTFDS